MEDLVVDLSRLQFAITALYHFLFVPLTIGLALLIAIIETVYVMTGKQIWKDMAKFWIRLFAINFAMGVATGITMEFQFGTNWAYYSHFVGDIFGVPLAIEGMMAFFLESTFVGVMYFGWDKLSKVQHLVVTWLAAIGANLSALWILIANGWMQHPVGAEFNFETMRMELSSIYDVIFNPVAQAKFVHTVSAGYVTGAVFMIAISSIYILKGKHLDIARRSFIVASSFGLLSALSVLVLGDDSGYEANLNQKAKMAAIEAEWHTEKPPAALTIIGWPDQEKMETLYAIKVPYLLGLIGTRSLDQEVIGIKEIVDHAKEKVKTGIIAYNALSYLREKDSKDEKMQKLLKDNFKDIGYALLLKKYTNDLNNASQELIDKAAKDTIPKVLPVFFSFRIMAGIGFYFIAFFGLAFYYATKRNFEDKRWFLKIAILSLPLPWIAAEAGWIIAEVGRQPWIIEGILPTFAGVSQVSPTHIISSLIGFVVLYTFLLVMDLILMVKYIKIGPEGK